MDLSLTCSGNTHVEFREGGYHYTWERVPLIINNVCPIYCSFPHLVSLWQTILRLASPLLVTFVPNSVRVRLHYIMKVMTIINEDLLT